RLFTDVQHMRDPDGSYWTGLVFTDGKRWPEERTTWTAAAVVLAADALSRTSTANGIFRDGVLD
ncbi:prenyltransferase, partial [Nocardia sp. NPDC058497]